MADPAVVANAIQALRITTRCVCGPWIQRGVHHPNCQAPWGVHVETLAAEVERLRRVDELARALVEPGWDVGHEIAPCTCASEHNDCVGCPAGQHAEPCLQCLLDALATEVRDA